MSTDIPEQPASPDYAAANREGIYADIGTLPDRRRIEQAAALGTKATYVDPTTGQTVNADFTGLGNMELAKQAAAIAGQTNADTQRQQLALRQELGLANVAQTTAEVKAADPLAYETRQKTTEQILGALDDPATAIGPSAGVAAAQAKVNALGQDGRLGNIYDEATRLLDPNVKDDSTAALNLALNQAVRDFNTGGKLDPNVQRELTNSVRSGQVARGNYLGDAAAVEETMNIGSALEQRKAAQLGALLDVQGRAFSQNGALRGEERSAATNRLGVLSGLANQQFGQDLSSASQGMAAAQVGANEERAARAESYGRDQQKLANASAIVLGQPITNQFGSLGAAQQGAVAYSPVGYQPGTTINANAGNQAAGFAQQNYGQLANMWSTQANIAQQDNAGMMGLIGGVGGAALGAMI